ncbi:MAG: DNA-binding GntR family transcriptional regulator [Paracoccaceae bacterium]
MRLAAKTFTASQIAASRRQIEDQKSCIDNDPERFIQLDDQFHRFFAQEIGHEQAWRVVESQKAQLDRVRFISLLEFPMGALVEQHIAIVDAIAAGDSDGAEAAMRLHLNNVLNDLPKIAATHPDLFV